MAPPVVNLIGQKFGRLTVIARAGSNSGGATWLCLCVCGTLLMAGARHLADWRSVVVIERPADGAMNVFGVKAWQAHCASAAAQGAPVILADLAAAGLRVINGADFTADGKLRKGRALAPVPQSASV